MALSSITKKLIMSISGLFLIIFLLLHMTINCFSVIDSISGPYGAADGLCAKGCEFMALPIVTIMVPVLAAGFIVHIIYALILSYGNYKARGTERYAVANKTKAEWASKNMLLLGVVVLGLVAFHLNHFWADMQLKEFMGEHAEDPYLLLNETFKNWWMVGPSFLRQHIAVPRIGSDHAVREGHLDSFGGGRCGGIVCGIVSPLL